MNFFLRSLLCSYTYGKFLFGYTKERNLQEYTDSKRLFLRCFFIISTLLLYFLIATLVLPFMLLRLVVDVYLRIKLGSNFGGLLKGQDAAIASLKQKVIIRIVFILEEEPNNTINWNSCLEVARKFHNSSYKLSSTIKTCFGYSYYVKNQLKFEDVVEEVRFAESETITKDNFLDYANKIHEKSAEKRLWSLAYLPQPIKWTQTTNDTKKYALVFSVNHCLTDGPNLVKYYMEFLMESSYVPPKSNQKPTLKNIPKFSIDDAYIYMNPLHPSGEAYPKLNDAPNHTYTALYSEETEKYLNLIKKIKTKLGVGFNSVLLGAFSYSLNNHLKKYRRNPMDLKLWAIIRPEEINLVFKSSNDHPLMNDVGNQIFNVPMLLSTSSTTERIRLINETLKEVRGSLDSTMTYTMAQISQLLPSFMQRFGFFAATGTTSSLVTNMSGVTSVSYSGYPVSSLLFFLSNVPIPFSFCILSLNGRLQITLNASGLYVRNPEELQDIIDGTLAYLDQVGEELLID